MDGGDMMEVEIYKERGEHWKGDWDKREERKRKNIEWREWTTLLFMQT